MDSTSGLASVFFYVHKCTLLWIFVLTKTLCSFSSQRKENLSTVLMCTKIYTDLEPPSPQSMYCTLISIEKNNVKIVNDH